MRYFDLDWTRRLCQGLASNIESDWAHCLYSPRFRDGFISETQLPLYNVLGNSRGGRA